MNRTALRTPALIACVLTFVWTFATFSPADPAAPPASQHSDELLTTPTTVATTAPATQPLVPLTGEAADAQKIVTYLASDELEGRGLSTHGLDLAADFIAGRFAKMGLEPLPGQKDYFQSFDMTWADDILPKTSLVLNDGASAATEPAATQPASQPATYTLGKDFTALSFSADKAFAAPVVFVGYGVTSDKPAYDDYAGIDVHGKVVLAMRFEPIDAKGVSRLDKAQWSNHARLDTKARVAAEHGAAALILMNPPASKTSRELLPFARTYKGSTATIPVIHMSQSAAEALLKSAGEDPGKIAQGIDESFKPHSFALAGAKLSGRVALRRTTRQLKNVIGYLPGKGDHADEYIVVGSHYDHLGLGGPGSLAPGSHAIHHGADDNASGTAAMIEIATTIANESHDHPPARSIIFMAFTAEEEGLIGSQHFVNHPLVPLDKIMAMLNMDMVGRVRNDTIFVEGAGTAPSFDKMIERAFAGSPLKGKTSGRGGLGPSDQMTFALKKIPVLFFFSGLHPDYHRPTDTADKINYPALAQAADAGAKIVDEMEAMPREKYVETFDSSSMMMPGMGTAGAGGGAGLGVVPDYTGDEQPAAGVRISGTSPGTPAAKAGLHAGDILTALGDQKLTNLMDLSDALAAHKPGDTVKLKYVREGKETSVTVTLSARRM